MILETTHWRPTVPCCSDRADEAKVIKERRGKPRPSPSIWSPASIVCLIGRHTALLLLSYGCLFIVLCCLFIVLWLSNAVVRCRCPMPSGTILGWSALDKFLRALGRGVGWLLSRKKSDIINEKGGRRTLDPGIHWDKDWLSVLDYKYLRTHSLPAARSGPKFRSLSASAPHRHNPTIATEHHLSDPEPRAVHPQRGNSFFPRRAFRMISQNEDTLPRPCHPRGARSVTRPRLARLPKSGRSSHSAISARWLHTTLPVHSGW
jgi:hypothetical protein